MSEPLWGHFSAKCSPEGGGAGIQAALDACEEGGAVLLEEGVFIVTETIEIRRKVHLIGRGTAELRREEGGAGGTLIKCTSPETATLDRLRICMLPGSSSAIYVYTPGHLQMQQCNISAAAGSVGHSVVDVGSSSASADLFSCSIRGGVTGLGFFGGASGRVEGCSLEGSSSLGFFLMGAGTSPLISRNTISNYPTGSFIGAGVDAGWSLGEGNVFNHCERGVDDYRAPLNPPRAPAPP